MESSSACPRTELALRADAVLVELDRIHASWADGRPPSAAELQGIADDLGEIRAVARFVSAVSGWDLPAYDRV